jgi:hypothetical protein
MGARQGPLDIPAPNSRGNAAPAAPSSEKAANPRRAGANGVPALAPGTDACTHPWRAP